MSLTKTSIDYSMCILFNPVKNLFRANKIQCCNIFVDIPVFTSVYLGRNNPESVVFVMVLNNLFRALDKIVYFLLVVH